MNSLTANEYAASLPRLYAHLRAQGLRSGHRSLVFISGSMTWCETQLLSLPGAVENALLVSTQSLCGLTPSKTQNTLGSEFSSLIINAHNNQKLNEWLAAAGCLTAGGVLLLLSPSIAEWPAQFGAQSRDGAISSSSFIERLLRLAPGLDGVYGMDELAGFSGNAPVLAGNWQQALPTADQHAALVAIKRVVSGRAKRPLVIRSDRGRGKTSVLGLAVAELFTSQDSRDPACRRVLITAPSFTAVRGAFEHLSMVLPEAQWTDDCCFVKSCHLRYLPFDAALSSRAHWDLVLVDEAAALPVAGLRTLLLRYPRLVFSSTVHGYEGSGRGFDIRFREILDTERPQWRRQALNEPIRWAQDDPLEKALNRLFLLDAEPKAAEPARQDWQVRLLTHEELSDENLLTQIFGLLVQAHYQTTPQDLQYLLDGDATLIVASCGDCVLGVCQILPEGGFADDLAMEVVTGRRRPRGHLVAQRLAHRSAEPVYLTRQSLRINRIAVVADRRRGGIGKALLNAAQQFGRSRGVAYLSSSFAADPALFEFWLAHGFSPAYLGSRRDSASGLYSLMVLKALCADCENGITQMARQLHSDLTLSLASVYSEISPGLLLTLLSASKNPSAEVSPFALTTVQRYCAGELIFEQAAASMASLCLNCDLSTIANAELAVARVLLGHSWVALAAHFELTGRAEVEQSLKRIFQQLILSLV